MLSASMAQTMLVHLAQHHAVRAHMSEGEEAEPV